jgi:hypothetical protein
MKMEIQATLSQVSRTYECLHMILKNITSTDWTSYPVHQQMYGTKYQDELNKLLPAVTTGELTLYHV